MTEMSRRFNFDDFDALIAEALDEHRTKDSKMAEEEAAWAEHERWEEHDRVPGEVGGVAINQVIEPTIPSPPEHGRTRVIADHDPETGEVYSMMNPRPPK